MGDKDNHFKIFYARILALNKYEVAFELKKEVALFMLHNESGFEYLEGVLKQ